MPAARAALLLASLIMSGCVIPFSWSGGVPDAGAVRACSDGIDNDGDGLTDWGEDLGCYGPDDDSEVAAPRAQKNGWTTYDKSPETQVIWVSSSAGDDAADGLAPARPVRTLAHAVTLLRTGQPDWLRLKRGDAWSEPLQVGDLSGLDAAHPMVVAGWGEGERPRIEPVATAAIHLCCGDRHDLAFLDLEVYYPEGDPASGAFVGEPAEDAVWQCCGDAARLLFEGCRFRYSAGVVLSTAATPARDFEFRRNDFSFNYGALYAVPVNGLLIEENLFDHDGWVEGVTAADQTKKIADLGGSNITLRGNLSLRAPSMHFNLFTGVADTGVTVSDNYFGEGEIGVGIGGDNSAGGSFAQIVIRDNVFVDLGATAPTGRSLAWGLELREVDQVDVSGNLFLYQASATTAFALSLTGTSVTRTNIVRNLVYDWGGHHIQADPTSWTGVTVEENDFQNPSVSGYLVRQAGAFTGVSYARNRYWSSAASGAWFSLAGSDLDFAGWTAASGETGAVVQPVGYPSPERRRLSAYHASLGGEATQDAFIAAARGQSRVRWRPELTAAAVNAWIRAGFGR
jgi:hypothetical protein